MRTADGSAALHAPNDVSTVSARQHAEPATLIDVIAASQASPPVLPALRRTGRTRRDRWRAITRTPWSVAGILVIQALLSLRLLKANTAFMDEALYLWSGHLEIAHLLYGASIPNFPTYFSGAPVIYPVIGALADAYGGLTLARLLSLAFMLGATSLLYCTTVRLFSRKAGTSAALIFAVLGPVQVLGSFATYDAMALFLLGLATWLTVRAQGRLGEFLLILAAVVLATADATKYATGLWDPVVIAMAALTARRGGWVRATLRGLRFSAYLTCIILIALFIIGGRSYVQGLMFTTLERQAGGTPASAAQVFGDSFNWVGIVFVLAAVGVAVSFTSSVRVRLICITLTGAILLAPAEQARIHILTSLHKHVAFGAWFAAAVAGYAIARGSEINPAKAWRLTAVAAGLTAFIGVPQASAMFHGWPNSTRMVTELAPVLAVSRCPCLVTENNVVNYYLLKQTLDDKFIGSFSFYYWDPRTRKVLHGMTAYKTAILSHYFHVVEIDPDENPKIYRPLASILKGAAGWRLVTSAPSGTRLEPFEIWQYVPGKRIPAKPRHK